MRGKRDIMDEDGDNGIYGYKSPAGNGFLQTLARRATEPAVNPNPDVV